MIEHVIEMLKISKCGHVRLNCGDIAVCFSARWSVDVLGWDADQGLICGWYAAVRRLIALWDIMIVALCTDYTQNTWCCFPRFVQHRLTNTLSLQASARVRWGIGSWLWWLCCCFCSSFLLSLTSSPLSLFFVRSPGSAFPCLSLSLWYRSVPTGESQQLLSSLHSRLSFLLLFFSDL